MKTLFRTLVAAAAFAFATSATAAVAVPDYLTLDFAGLAGGSLDGVDGDWATGTDIAIDTLTVEGAPAVNGGVATSYAIDSGYLNFDTTSEGTQITITGSVDILGITDTNTVLFSGAFNLGGWNYTDGLYEVFSADGSGVVDTGLLGAIGESPNANPFAFVGFSLESANGTVLSTDFMTTSVGERTPEVPVPAAAWLFGSGLLGLVGVGRRKV